MLQEDRAEGVDSQFELEVLHELSRARSNPTAVAESIRGRLPHFKGKDYFPSDRGGKTAVVTKEGQAAVHDAIRYLEDSAGCAPLGDACVQGLRLAAEDHLLDLGKRGAVGHQGSDGSSSSERMSQYGSWSGKCGECLWFGRMGTSAKQIVEDLIIDDGVPSRGHRLGIYDQAFRVAGVRMGAHKTFGACCVIDFAAGYKDDEESLIKRVTAGPRTVISGKEPVKTQWRDLGLCPGCKETIHGGAVIEALGHKWHRDCFACQAEGCGKSLRGVPYQEHGGMPYCKDCYYSRFGSICHGCGEKIHGGVLKASGHTWHKECFVCSNCHGPLESRYATHDGKPVCAGCNMAPGRTSPPLARDGLRPPGVKSPPPGKAAPATRVGVGAKPRTPPPKAGARGKTPPPQGKAVSLPKIGAGRGGITKAVPKTTMAAAKRTMESMTMNYSDLV
jgi:hypothetical protein